MKRIILTLATVALCFSARAQYLTNQADEAFYYDAQKYTSAEQLYQACRSGTAMPSLLKKGARYRIVGLPENERYLPSALRVELENKKKTQAWIIPALLPDRTQLIPLFPNFREAYRTNALLRRVAPGMNRDEVFVCSNVHFMAEDETPSPWNENYTMWGDERNFMLFYHDSLCCSQMATINLFYYKPHYTVELAGVDCDRPVGNQHVKGSSYWDENFEINWALGTHTLNFAIQNNALATLRLVWDDMVFIGKKSERVIHNGVRFEERYYEQTNSVVARGSQYTDGLLPVAGLQLNENKGWMAQPIVRNFTFAPNDDSNLETIKNTPLKVLFVVLRDGQKFEYTFTLKITDVTYTLEQGSIDQEYMLSALPV